jgi:hypothetical protein
MSEDGEVKTGRGWAGASVTAGGLAVVAALEFAQGYNVVGIATSVVAVGLGALWLSAVIMRLKRPKKLCQLLVSFLSRVQESIISPDYLRADRRFQPCRIS